MNDMEMNDTERNDTEMDATEMSDMEMNDMEMNDTARSDKAMSDTEIYNAYMEMSESSRHLTISHLYFSTISLTWSSLENSVASELRWMTIFEPTFKPSASARSKTPEPSELHLFGEERYENEGSETRFYLFLE